MDVQRRVRFPPAVLLLCAGWMLLADAVPARDQACLSLDEVETFERAHVNLSNSVTVTVCDGKKLNISLKGSRGDCVCHWIRGKDVIMSIKGNNSNTSTVLSVGDSGDYKLNCESSEFNSSTTMQLRVIKRPTKPQMMLDEVNHPHKSPKITCTSNGNPKPTITWGSEKSPLVKSEISSASYHDKPVMCCANNTEGQECSQLYDYDLESNVMKDEASNITVAPGQSLLLRCRERVEVPQWEKNGKILDASALACSGEKRGICLEEDKYDSTHMVYLLIYSVHMQHSGTYTCRRRKNPLTTKPVYIHVQAESFVSVQLDKNITIRAPDALGFCLQANVSYHPVLQLCSWEAPNGTMTKCIRDTWVTKHSTVKLCGALTTGDYSIHLMAGGQTEAKVIYVCVVVTERPNLEITTDGNHIILTTKTLVPANYSWMSCPDQSCADTNWTEIAGTFQTDSDHLCNKTIISSVKREEANKCGLKFCITNSVGSWCEKIPYLQYSTSLFSYIPPKDAPNTMPDIIIYLLLLALAAVIGVLFYCVKKKKPQYQPQLQMLQMVGPNDNDYIYINFKDFDYDSKWEFPRENLELGKELGSGAFGTVVQAMAYGINKPGVSHQVAVKMLKEKHQAVEKEALMSELKMLIHIGQHGNIVNLLGACTETGPIYLIFQYCCYGDLLNYLKSNSEHYHKSVVDAFNTDRFSTIYNNLQLRKNVLEAEAGYVPMHASTTRGQEETALLNLSSADQDINDEMNENLCDQSDDLQALTYDDLLSFAFQVAKGMEFLSSMNCIHRDLAARNVLVSKGRLAKIGDFGLARDIDNDSNYVVRGNVRLPVKWMAPESIFQGIYTMQSDVWAYGILLWEIFSLGVTPYPGMKVDHTFYSMIERGYKMDPPYYASDNVYRMMCKCWNLDPSNRPSFSKVVSFMYNELMDREEKLYHNISNQTSSDYQNAPTAAIISTSTKQDDNKAQSGNDYQGS